MPHPRILSIATATPPFRFDQKDVMRRASELFGGGFATLERLLPVYGNAAIETRYSCVPMDWYMTDHGFGERNSLYIEHAVETHVLHDIRRSISVSSMERPARRLKSWKVGPLRNPDQAVKFDLVSHSNRVSRRPRIGPSHEASDEDGDLRGETVGSEKTG